MLSVEFVSCSMFFRLLFFARLACRKSFFMKFIVSRAVLLLRTKLYDCTVPIQSCRLRNSAKQGRAVLIFTAVFLSKLQPLLNSFGVKNSDHRLRSRKNSSKNSSNWLVGETEFFQLEPVYAKLSKNSKNSALRLCQDTLQGQS